MLRASSHPGLAPACRSTSCHSSPTHGSELGRTLRPGAVVRLQPNGHAPDPLGGSRILRHRTLHGHDHPPLGFGSDSSSVDRHSLHELSTDAAVLPHCSHLPSLRGRCKDSNSFAVQVSLFINLQEHRQVRSKEN
ncbi:unnamed protein product [Urochloa humidicola]